MIRNKSWKNRKNIRDSSKFMLLCSIYAIMIIIAIAIKFIVYYIVDLNHKNLNIIKTIPIFTMFCLL
jgi:hypothetical protein